MSDDFSNRLTPGAFEARLAAGPEVPRMGIGTDGRPVALSDAASAALRLHDAALVMRGKIDVPGDTEEGHLYEAATQAAWRAQRYLIAVGVEPPCWLAEPGEADYQHFPGRNDGT